MKLKELLQPGISSGNLSPGAASGYIGIAGGGKAAERAIKGDRNLDWRDGDERRGCCDAELVPEFGSFIRNLLRGSYYKLRGELCQ